MTAVIDHQPTLTDALVPASLARSSAEAFAWPTTIDPRSSDVLLWLGTNVDALFITAGFASEVNGFLARHLSRAPVITMQGAPGEWVFLTEPRTTMRMSAWQDLVRIGVGWKRRGDTIPLPALDTTEGARWLEPPGEHVVVPPWTAVVAAARTCASGAGWC